MTDSKGRTPPRLSVPCGKREIQTARLRRSLYRYWLSALPQRVTVASNEPNAFFSTTMGGVCLSLAGRVFVAGCVPPLGWEDGPFHLSLDKLKRSALAGRGHARQ
jgi:hypothetical protein